MSLLESRSRVLAFAFVVMGLAVTLHAVHAVFGVGHPELDGFVTDWVYTAIELVAVAVCGGRALTRSQDRGAWLLITAGLIGWTGGDLVWTLWLNNVPNPPYPSIADPLYLAMYPTIYAGLVLLMRSQFRHAGAAVWLDGLVVGLTMAAIGADLIFPAIRGSSTDGTAAIALNLTYLLCDFLLLVFIAVGFALSGWRPGRQWLTLALGIVVLACADMLFLYQEAHDTYVAGRILDTMWPASMALLALAAWQPASRAVRRTSAGRHTVMLPAVFGLIALALLVSATAHPLTRLSVALATGALLAAGARAAFTYLENVRMLERQTRDAITDALTGLGNRRRLMDDLSLAVQQGLSGQPATLAFFDLNGFKRYNDSFGHGAGDSLLTRLGTALAATVSDRGEAYRLGGDEFCVLLAGRFPRSDAVVAQARAALSEQGSGFTVTASCGVVVVPEDASTVTLALNLADERMYADKGGGERVSHSQTQSVLMQLLTEREPTLHSHVCDVGSLAMTIGRRFELDSEQLDELRRAAELHDIGKLAVPEEILHKPGPLSESELHFMRQHTIVGERILNVAPALRMVARLVRSSHERWDGKGYPDKLTGPAIPLGSRIIAACDAYDVMVSDRPYQAPRSSVEAIAELRRHAGTQFDPDVVQALCRHLEVADGSQHMLFATPSVPQETYVPQETI
jgi:two-component system, cell cycle response regulator